ncbi:hypothetical protein MesoLjLc_51890 [Mesorhizobium sp. L-8-10]|uniref:hypothetical protein n=1 Tax=Mesorhizobium sp. L-8-10 TaxID=2744523 RepID=UPI001927CD9A|nr:hypothetical protein [Mesorhizobium sp. L-8-10]BCH33259.1 hypothetical protein MesoLjLc_51890 [Mesorhizobium sp. L-8-10]
MRDLSPPTVMFIDTETSGLYRKDLSIDDPGQPWAMSIAAALCNDAEELINFFSFVIKADGRTAKENAVNVHGISARATSQIGIPEPRALGALTDMLKTAPMDVALKVVTFGDFDGKILSSLFARFAISQNKPSNTYDRLWLRRPLTEFVNLQVPVCQMACKLPSEFEGGGDYKWPSLDEACEIMLGMAPRPGRHDAWEDLCRLKALYFECVKRGYIETESANTGHN